MKKQFKTPDWYWTRGLHDARILEVNQQELMFDYTQKNPRRNYLEIIIDAKDALFDTEVKSIHFYNYKVLLGDINIKEHYWFEDSLLEENGKYKLILTTKVIRKEFVLELQFDTAEVIK